MPSSLELRDLRVEYRRGWRRSVCAVDGLSLTVEPGEVVGFIGPNGAGKSSTIKALMGFLQPTSGEARLLGWAAGDPRGREQVGFLPEVATYYPWLTELETLGIFGALAGRPRHEVRRQSGELLVRLGLGGRERERLQGYSKGMLQRVGIAQALLGEPRLLVLDEVSSGLDPLGRRHLRDLLGERKAAGVTIFFSSHELTEVAQLCDRVALVNHGRLVEEQRVSDLLRDLRRFWVRFRAEEAPRFPARREGDAWVAEFETAAAWQAAVAQLRGLDGRLLDAGEQAGGLEDYFLRKVAAAA